MWLQQAMAAGRAQLEQRWFDLYLTGPRSRFLLMPGTCGGTMWAGILMPSMDKVGRYFPLTIAAEIGFGPAAMLTAFLSQGWYAAIERTALSALNTKLLPDDLEESLAANPFPLSVSHDRTNSPEELATWFKTDEGVSRMLEIQGENAIYKLFIATAECLLNAAGVGKSFWWVVSADGVATQLRCFTGLPPENYFINLFDVKTFPSGDSSAGKN
jgi:type VI secretion system protein ImpM